MASRSSYDLSHETYLCFLQFAEAMKKASIEFIVTCTHRSGNEQDALYAQGRTKPGRIVTNARAGQSAHNCTEDGKPAAKAFDIVIMQAGKPDWDGSHPAWLKAGLIGEACGLEWAGRWRSFPEKPHFQLPHWDK